MIFDSLNSQSIRRAVYVYHTSSRGKSNRSHSKSEFQMFSLICGRHVGVPQGTLTWRLHNELYKFAWNVSTNNSRTVYRTDLEKLFIC